MSLRRRLVILVGGPVLVCVVVAVVAVLVTSRQQAKLQGGHRAQELVSRAYVTVETELARLEMLARSLSQDPLVHGTLANAERERGHWTPPGFEEYLDGGTFVEIGTREGGTLYSSLDAEGVWAVPARSGLHVMRPSQRSALPWSRNAGIPVLLGATPVVGRDGDRQGHVVVGRPLTDEFLGRIAAHTGYPIATWGPDGTPVSSSQNVSLPHLSDVLDASALTRLAAGRTVMDHTDQLGTDSIACFWTLPQTDAATPAAYFAVVAPPTVLATTNWSAIMSVGAIALACILITVVLTARLGNRLVADVAQLSALATRIGKGELDARVDASALKEMGSLGTALNAMAARIESAQEELSGSEERLLHATIETRRAYEDALGSLATALDTRDNETREHSYRVMEFALRIARQMDLDAEDMISIERGALLHDIGKIGIPDSILLKPNQLSTDEWAVMKEHPRIGFAMLSSVEFLSQAAEIVYAHHERWDGEGYPRGLAGEEIPIGARIFAVVDAFDAITSDRPYRKAMSYEAAKSMLVEDAGSQFDPAVIEAFCQVEEAEWEELRHQVSEYVEVTRERVARKVVDFDVRTAKGRGALEAPRHGADRDEDDDSAEWQANAG
jgi:putative nucleotidyltransferase with HDIG domain